MLRVTVQAYTGIFIFCTAFCAWFLIVNKYLTFLAIEEKNIQLCQFYVFSIYDTAVYMANSCNVSAGEMWKGIEGSL